MSKRILVLGRSYHPDGKETADVIYDGLKKVELLKESELILAHFKEIVMDISNETITVTDSKSQRNLLDVDAVLMTNWFSHASIRKDLGYSLGLIWAAKNTAVFNSESIHSRSTSKLSQMVIAAQNQVPIARTIFSLDFDALAARAQEVLGFPMIIKDAQGSRGNGNYLVKSPEELAALKAEHTESHPFVAQKFIEGGSVDYRFFVAGGKTRLIIKRIGNADSHLTNTSAGASTEVLQPADLGEEVLDLVHTCSKLLHREVTGIDIMFDKTTNKPYFLEANPIPQIATGSNIELKLTALATALLEAANKENLS
jgi:glutathione synthase/RimK-type ligase-like ATP-grasp enzyme